MKPLGARLNRWLWPIAWILSAMSLYLAGITVRTVWTARSEVPWRDQWTFLDDARKIEAHVWPRLWYSYWGHRPVVARLVTLFDVRWFHGLNTPVLVLILTEQTVHAALLIWIAWRLFDRFSRPVFLIAAALIVQLSFLSLQLENLLWAGQSGYILVWTAATASFFLLAAYAGTRRMNAALLGGCVLSGIVSTLSSPNGVCVWPVLFLQAWVLRLNGRVRVLLALTGALAIGIYLWGYDPGPPMGMGPVRALLHPLKSIPIVGMLAAAPLTAWSIHGAMVVGCLALALALYILVRAVSSQPPALLTVYASLATFALFTFASMVASRISPEFVESKVREHQLVIPSRYYTTVAFFWIGVAGVSIWIAMKNRREWPQLAGAALMVMTVTLGTTSWQIGEAANWRGYYHELDVAGSALIMHVNDAKNPFLEQIYPESPLRAEIAPWLEKRRLAVFAERRATLPGTHIDLANIDAKRCRGEAQTIVSLGGGVFRVAGWAADTATGQAPRDLVFANHSATVVGVGRSGLRRPDLRGSVGEVSLDRIGWQGYARVTGEPAITVYGALDDAGHYCLIGKPVPLPVK